MSRLHNVTDMVTIMWMASYLKWFWMCGKVHVKASPKGSFSRKRNLISHFVVRLCPLYRSILLYTQSLYIKMFVWTSSWTFPYIYHWNWNGNSILSENVVSILWGKLIVKIMQDLLQEVHFGAFVTKRIWSSCTMSMYLSSAFWHVIANVPSFSVLRMYYI